MQGFSAYKLHLKTYNIHTETSVAAFPTYLNGSAILVSIKTIKVGVRIHYRIYV